MVDSGLTPTTGSDLSRWFGYERKGVIINCQLSMFSDLTVKMYQTKLSTVNNFDTKHIECKVTSAVTSDESGFSGIQ